jgi:hypothetical protein
MFEDKYNDSILGTNSYIDRIIITGSIIPLSYCTGLEHYLSSYGILIKDFKAYSKKLAELLKENAKIISETEGAHYEYLDSPKIRKEQTVKEIIQQRGDHPGMVAVLTTLEVDNSYDIQFDSVDKKLILVPRRRKCLHIYFYFIDEQLGLCYFRIQTFFPFKIQIYFNGREQLARKLDNNQILYEKENNCITYLSDFTTAQQLADDLDISKLHARFDQWVEKFVIILPELTKHWDLSYHWSIKQIEYSKDIIFKIQQELESLYFQLIQHSALSALPEDILSFLGKKTSGKQSGRIDTSLKKSYFGYRIKHRNGAISIKMYNKSGNVLRIEITINNVSEIKVNREVQQRNGHKVVKLASMKKSIYSLDQVIFFSNCVISRYLDFLSKMLNTTKGIKELRQMTERITEKGKNYKGFNPLHREESIIFEELVNGGSFVNGFTNKVLRTSLSKRLEDGKWTPSKVSRLLKRLRVFGFVHKISKSYKYILTEKGRLLITLCLKLKNMTMIPTVDALLRQMEIKTA